MNTSVALATVQYLRKAIQDPASINAGALSDTCLYLQKCVEGDDITECIRNGVHFSLAQLLGALPPPNFNYAEWVAATLAAFASIPAHRRQMVLDGVPESVFAALENFLRPSSTAALLSVIVPLSLDVDNKRDLLQSGVMKSLVRYLNVYRTGDVKLLANSCEIIRNVSFDNESCNMVVQEGTMEVLVHLWDTRSSDPPVIAAVCGALAAVLVSTEHQLRLLNYDVLPRCVSCLTLYPSSVVVVSAVTTLIGCVVTLPQASEVFGSMGGVRAIIATLQSGDAMDVAAIGSVCLALRCLTMNCVQNVCDVMLDLPVLIGCLIRCNAMEDPKVVLAVAGLLSCILINPQGVSYSAKCGAIDFLSKGAYIHLRSPQHIDAIMNCFALSAMHSDIAAINEITSVPHQFAIHEVPALIVSTVQMHATNCDIVRFAMSALARAALWPIPSIRDTFMGNTIPLLLSVAWQSLHNQTILEPTMLMLWSLCLNSEMRAYVVDQFYCLVSKVIRVALELHSHDAKVTAMASGAIWALSLDPRASAQLGHEGCIVDQIQWVRKYCSGAVENTGSDVLHLILSTFWCMCSSLSNQKIFTQNGGLDMLSHLLRNDARLPAASLTIIYRSLKLLLVYPDTPETLGRLRVQDVAVTHCKMNMGVEDEMCEAIITFLWGMLASSGTHEEHIVDLAKELLSNRSVKQRPSIVEGCTGILWASYCVGQGGDLTPSFTESLIESATLHAKNKGVAECFSGLLWAVCGNDASRGGLRMLFSRNVVPLCITILRSHASNEMIVELITCSLASILTESNNSALFLARNDTKAASALLDVISYSNGLAGAVVQRDPVVAASIAKLQEQLMAALHQRAFGNL